MMQKLLRWTLYMQRVRELPQWMLRMDNIWTSNQNLEEEGAFVIPQIGLITKTLLLSTEGTLLFSTEGMA